MPAFAAVLDACVLVPAPLCDFLLRAASVGLFQLLWTDDILEEVRRTLVGDLGKSEEQVQRRIAAMREAFPYALITYHTPLIDTMPNDPKDRHVLAAAVASGAEIVVTSNLRDFSPQALAPFPVAAHAPDTFLNLLYDLDRELVREVLRRQAAALRHPPLEVADILGKLAVFAPAFVSRVQDAQP